MSTTNPTAELKLGDRVRILGTVEKTKPWPRGQIRYEDAGVPGFVGYAWKKPVDEADTFHPRAEGVIVGKRRYNSMEYDEGMWVADGVQSFIAYLVAFHLSRNPVMVRADQLELLTPDSSELLARADADIALWGDGYGRNGIVRELRDALAAATS